MDKLVPRDARGVFVAPHPDDEVLATGGLLSLLAQSEREVLIIGVTEGEASHEKIAPASMARRRGKERAIALERLGLPRSAIETLHFPDGDVSDDIPRLTCRLREYLQSTDVVFYPWERDGHPDHEATGLAALEAIRATGAVGHAVPIWAWNWCKPGTHEMPFERAFKVPLSAKTIASKRAAIAAFSSQLERQPGRAPILTNGTLAYFTRPFEVILT
ncbi:MAG: PIG-L family deacetylase [Burkholderiaceae bacterium]|jgi:LmbE family N-acetylglucosaminyl deacetylase